MKIQKGEKECLGAGERAVGRGRPGGRRHQKDPCSVTSTGTHSGIRERAVILTSTHMQQPLAFRNGSSPGGLSSLPT